MDADRLRRSGAEQGPSFFSKENLVAFFRRLLPFVAYQWKDGPWQQAYARLGEGPAWGDWALGVLMGWVSWAARLGSKGGA